MSITVKGNNNTVAGRDNIINSYLESTIVDRIPDELRSDFTELAEYVKKKEVSDTEKESRIYKFRDSLVKAGATTIVAEVIKSLFSLF